MQKTNVKCPIQTKSNHVNSNNSKSCWCETLINTHDVESLFLVFITFNLEHVICELTIQITQKKENNFIYNNCVKQVQMKQILVLF